MNGLTAGHSWGRSIGLIRGKLFRAGPGPTQSARELSPQPRAANAKLMPHDMRGTIERQRHLFRGHPAEVVHLDDLGKRGLFAFQCFEGSVQVQELDVLGRMLAGNLEARLPGNAFLAAASFGGDVRPRGIDEDLSHHPRHQSQVVAILSPERGIQDRLAGTWIVPR